MGRPPKTNRDDVADITLSFRFTAIEREALERLAQRRNAELRGTGATVTATSIGRALVRRELEESGIYAEVERERGAPSTEPAQALLPGLGNVTPEPHRPRSVAPHPASSRLNVTKPPKPAARPSVAVEPAGVAQNAPAVARSGPLKKGNTNNGKPRNGSAKSPAETNGKPVKASAAASKGKAKPSRPTMKPKAKSTPTPPRRRR